MTATAQQVVEMAMASRAGPRFSEGFDGNEDDISLLICVSVSVRLRQVDF